MSEAKVKLFMCVHKPYSFLPPLAVAVQGGAALKPRVPNAVGDDGACGSISEKNAEYCELTVQYYAYKNEEAEVYGFCHYRRFFAFGKRSARPYLVYKSIPNNQVSILGTATDAARIAASYDIVLPCAEDSGVSAREHYAAAKHHYASDLALFESLISELYPELAPFAAEYLGGRRQYFCNMFFMRRALFRDYSERLFSLLAAFDERKTPHGDFQSDRTDGYLAERFLGIYAAFAAARGASVLEVPRVDVGAPLKKRLAYRLLPPNSLRRKLLKRLVCKLKRAK